MDILEEEWFWHVTSTTRRILTGTTNAPFRSIGYFDQNTHLFGSLSLRQSGRGLTLLLLRHFQYVNMEQSPTDIPAKSQLAERKFWGH